MIVRLPLWLFIIIMIHMAGMTWAAHYCLVAYMDDEARIQFYEAHTH